MLEGVSLASDLPVSREVVETHKPTKNKLKMDLEVHKEMPNMQTSNLKVCGL